MILDKYMLVVEVTLFFDDCCVLSVDLPMIPVFSQLLVCLVSDVSVLFLFRAQLLGHVILIAQRPIVVKLSRGRSVCLSVRTYIRASVCPVHCGKMADGIQMPFGIIGWMGPGMRQVVGFGDRSMGRVLLEANLGCAIVTNEDFAAYVCDSATTWASSQITLCRLVMCHIIIHVNAVDRFQQWLAVWIFDTCTLQLC